MSYNFYFWKAANIPPGSDGLVALETFQGSRTPVTDPLARGCLIGLTLAHTRAHIWRALLESVCYGTRACLEALSKAGFGNDCSELFVAGGATRSDFWLQMHSDITGLPVTVGECDNAPLIGSAILAAVGSGIYKTVEEAVKAMVRPTKRIFPRSDLKPTYDALYAIYKFVSPAVRDITHSLARGTVTSLPTKDICGLLPSGRDAYVVPSILAADMTALGDEVVGCHTVGAKWVHVDVCDGGEVCQGSLTFGALVVDAIHKKCKDIFLDVHVVAASPMSMVSKLAEAGAGRFTFQWETVSGLEQALELAQAIRKAGMSCGISVSPETSVEEIYPILNEVWSNGVDSRTEPLVDLVDVLAVRPGVGGQKFISSVLEKVSSLRRDFPTSLQYIAVDGGIDRDTAPLAAAAGANILIAGSSIFGPSRCSNDGFQSISDNMNLLLEILLYNGK